MHTLVSSILNGGSGVNITPNSTGLPGVSALTTMVGALLTIGVIASVAGLAISGITWAVGNHSSNPSITGRGKTGVLVSLGAAILIGGAMVLVNFFFNAGQSL